MALPGVVMGDVVEKRDRHHHTPLKRLLAACFGKDVRIRREVVPARDRLFVPVAAVIAGDDHYRNPLCRKIPQPGTHGRHK